jgi:LacI family transcriptional regulator
VATIRDVASHAGVSLGTASRALTGSGPVSEASRQKVLEAAKELGYRVNKAARSLRTNRTDTIGLLVSDVRNPFFAELAYVIDRTAAQHGRVVITMNADESVEGQTRALKAFKQEGVDGLIAVPQDGSLTGFPEDIPTVFVDRTSSSSDPAVATPPVVSTDHYEGMAQLVRYLVEKGHTDIGLISGSLHTSTGRTRKEAAVEELARHGLKMREECFAYGDFQWEKGRIAALKIFDQEILPTALIAGDNMMAIGALRAAQERNIKIGQDIALVAFDDLPAFELISPPLTVVAQDVEGLGRQAVDSLELLLAGKKASDITLPAQMIVRESCTIAPHRLSDLRKE